MDYDDIENPKLKFPPKKSQSGNGMNLVMILNYNINEFLEKIDPNDLDEKDNSVKVKDLHVTILPNISDDIGSNKQAMDFIENQVRFSGVLSEPLTLGKVGVFDMSSRNILNLDVLDGGRKIESLHEKLSKTIPNDPYFKDHKIKVTIARLKDTADFYKYLKEFKNVTLTIDPKEVLLLNSDGQKLLTISH